MWTAAPARHVPAAGRPAALRLGFTLYPGMRVGLFGGSFDPAHDGHAHVAEIARVRLGLDRVIWLVSPGNPLKQGRRFGSMPARIAAARRLAPGPAMMVSDAEARLSVRYTIDTLRILKARFPAVHFLWIMGSDGLAGLHHWRGWPEIMRLMPVAVVARPDSLYRSRAAPAARRFGRARRRAGTALTLPAAKPPAWIYLTAPLNAASSTALRRSTLKTPLDRAN